MKKKKTVKKQQHIEEYKSSGLVISFDPSTLSVGYAVAYNGEVLEKGVLKFPKSKCPTQRMGMLAQELQDFPRPDVVIVENIPVQRFIPGNKNYRTPDSWKHLHWSVGVIWSHFPEAEHVEIHPLSWKPFVKKCPSYEKSDDMDAVLLLCTYFHKFATPKEIEYYDECLRKDLPAQKGGTISKGD